MTSTHQNILTSRHHRVTLIPMRTTLQLDDDVYEAARSLAATEGRSLGEIVSRLARQGLAPRGAVRERNGFPLFDVSADARPITGEMVKRALEDDQ